MFASLRTGVSCPRCQQGLVARGRRRVWMRRLPGSRYYCCRSCGTRFLKVYCFTFRVPLRD